MCTLLDEESLLKHCDGKSTDACLPDSGVPFQYFVLDGSTIIGLLERPVGSSGGGMCCIICSCICQNVFLDVNVHRTGLGCPTRNISPSNGRWVQMAETCRLMGWMQSHPTTLESHQNYEKHRNEVKLRLHQMMELLNYGIGKIQRI